MTKTNTRSRIVSILLVLVMLLTMVPITGVTAFAASYAKISVNDILLEDNYYLKSNSATGSNYSNTEPSSYVAWYKNGVLTLKGYNGKGIETQGVAAGELTVKLIGSNSINNGALQSDNGGDITVTSDSSGTLSISKTTSGSNPAIGIETGLSASYTTGNVTIKGNAKVTINVTHNGTSTYEKAYGIFAKENITISENASVDITCATPNNTTGGGNCNGLYAAKDVTIDTNGTIKIDVTNAGKDKDNGYSYGVYYMRTATLTKVGNMEVQWKKEGNNTRYSGGAFIRGVTFSDTDHAINEDTTNCYASYRYGTSYYTVTVQDGQLTGPGVKYANGSGYFLAGDKVNITPATKKGRSGEEIPFKEWTFSDVMLDKSATTASNSFTVPGKDVTVTAKHSPFVGTPTFTSIGTTGTHGTLTFKTVVKADAAYEGFRLVKEGNENNESSYNLINPDTTSTSSPYEYSYETSIYDVKKGNYYVAELLDGTYYLSEKFTVNYTAPVTTYTISFNANGGTGTMKPMRVKAGENYTLPECTFTPPEGREFAGWLAVNGTVYPAGTKVISSYDQSFKATWKDKEAAEVTISFDPNGGTGTMQPMKVKSGENFTLPECTFTPPEGKEFAGWLAVNGTVYPAGNVVTSSIDQSFKATWKDTAEVDVTQMFTDVTKNWAYPGIRYCVTNGLMSGTSDTTFAPDAVMTRAQIVQVLYNLAGEPAVAGTTPFTDLTSDWYQDAVLWAYRTGVVAGTSDTTFDPDAPVTREQIAVILMGYAEKVLGLDFSADKADLTAFPDGASVSDWARDAVAEAVALGLISGAQTKDGTFLQPQGGATREQAATILMGFYSLVDVDLRMA